MSTHKNIRIVVILAVIIVLLGQTYVYSVTALGERDAHMRMPFGDPFLVIQVTPSNGSHNVTTDALINVDFNQAVDISTVDTMTFAVRGSLTGDYSGTYSQLNDSIQFDPSQNFKAGEEIVVNLSGEIQSEDGASLVPYAWEFRTVVSGGTGFFINSGELFTDTTNSPDSKLGDLDNDGDLDAFVVTHDHSKVFFNDGNGNFIDTGQSISNSWGWRIALGDLDSDGDLDAYIGDHDTGHMVLLNNGAGFFVNSGQLLGDGETYGLALGDIDGDGDLDVAAANYDGNDIWLNDGAGIFTRSNQNLGIYGIDVALGDIDTDGDLDLFFVNDIYFTNGLPAKVWLNNGSGIFSDSGQSLGNSEGVSVALGDFDSDGDLDAFVANEDYQPDKVWVNNGNGVFTDSGQNLGSAYSLDIAIGDLDNDGDLDVLVATGHADGHQSDANKVWLNDGTGTFYQGIPGFGPSSSGSAVVGDTDDDGDLDALLGYGDDQPVRLWENSNNVFKIYLPLSSR